jgi:hypothetical protein
MPLRYRYDPATDIVRVHATGAISGSEIRDYFQALVRETWWRPGMRFLADNREVTSMPPHSGLEIGALAMVRSAAYGGGARVSVVVADSLQYGVVRQFDGLSAEAGAEMRPFYDEAEAIAWLTRPDGARGR